MKNEKKKKKKKKKYLGEPNRSRMKGRERKRRRTILDVDFSKKGLCQTCNLFFIQVCAN